MSGQDKNRGVALLAREHAEMQNPWGASVIGWKPTSEGEGLCNSKAGFGMMRVVLFRIVDGIKQFLYDQPMLFENPGAIVVAQLQDGRVCLVNNYRMVGERPAFITTKSYIQCLQDAVLWGQVVADLGASRWEVPRGIAPPSEESGESLEQFVLKTAKLEALQEAGLRINSARIVGRVNTNPTFFAHAQYVIHAIIDSVGMAEPENLEMIDGRQFFTKKQLRDMMRNGELDDGLTFSALWMCGL